MAKSDVTFTIGADGSAMATELGKMAKTARESLEHIGQMFFGLQGIAAGVRMSDTTPFQTAPAPSFPRIAFGK